jgi:DNA-binding NarL/FixJ family response regulator
MSAPLTKASTSPPGSPAGAGETTTVAVVEDNPGLRRSLERLLRCAPNLRCVGAWADGETALAEVTALQPNVVLMDINLPGMSGIECTAALKLACPQSQVIMVTVYEDTENIFRALQAGACGYLLKRDPSAEILEAIAEVRHGGAPMTSEIARRVVEAFRTPAPAAAATVVLSGREQELLALLSKGSSNKEIADTLGIAYLTVKVHLKHIYEKLHVRSRTEALLKFMGDRGVSPAAPGALEASAPKPRTPPLR